jgi:hypothetical protein
LCFLSACSDCSCASDEPKRGFFGNLLRNLTGRALDKGDLEPVLAGLQDHLIKKNVASDVSIQVIAVGCSLFCL